MLYVEMLYLVSFWNLLHLFHIKTEWFRFTFSHFFWGKKATLKKSFISGMKFVSSIVFFPFYWSSRLVRRLIANEAEPFNKLTQKKMI